MELIGFHGSRKKFNQFSLKYFGQSDAGQWGEGVYFSNKKEVALSWGNIIYKCKLHFDKPFIVRNDDTRKIDYFLSLGETNKESTDKLKEMDYDGVISYSENWYINGESFEADQYVVFDPKDIEILEVEETSESKEISEAFETHNKLNPRLFNNSTKKMRREVRERLIEIADKFVDSLKEDGVPLKVYDYWVLGSNAAYNYTSKSDIDTHIIVNMEDVDVAPEVLTILYNYAKSKFNDDYDITIRGQEVELYIEDINASAISNGVYSLKRDKWIKEPEPMKESSIDVTVEDEYKEWESKFDNAIESEDIEKLQSFVDDIYILRKDSLAKDGEFGLGNLIFKEMRNQDKLQQIKDKIKELESKELTLESLNEAADNEDYYRFTIKNRNGRDMGKFSRVISKLLPSYYDENSPLYDIDYDMYTIELDTPIPPDNKITKDARFAYKKSFVDKHKEEFEDLELNLKEIGYGLITKRFKRPSNIIYEDDVQIAYIPNMKEKLSETMERTAYNAWHAWPQYRQKYGKTDSFFELQHNFHLTDEEMKWILDRCLERGLIDEYTKDYVVDYLKLNESLLRSNNTPMRKNYLGMENLIDEAINRGVQPYDLFEHADMLVDADSFFKYMVSGTDTHYQKSPEYRILNNNKNNIFYQTLLAYLDSLGTGNKNYPKIEPALVRKDKWSGRYIPTDGRHRAKLCSMLGIKLPVDVYEVKQSSEELVESFDDPKDIFDTNRINIPFYDELLKSQEARKRENRDVKIVQMSPREYFRGCAKVFNSTFDKQIRQVRGDKETLDYIQSELDKGHKLPLTWLDYGAERSQDGRHRMYVVGNAFGWDEKYPVAVFTTADEQEAERRKKAKTEERITRYFYRVENKLFGYSYRDLEELKEQIEYLMNNYLDGKPEVEVKQQDKQLVIIVNGVEFTYSMNDFDWEEKSNFDNDKLDDFDYDDLEV